MIFDIAIEKINKYLMWSKIVVIVFYDPLTDFVDIPILIHRRPFDLDSLVFINNMMT